MKYVETINPATEEKVKKYKIFEKRDLDRSLNNSKKASENWKKLSVKQRVSIMKGISKELLRNKNEYARTITIEMGKPISQSIGEIEKCAWLCDYFSKNAENFLKNEIIKTENKKSYIRFDPLGKILCIMPWNFPFWQVFRFAIPSLYVGNAVILKHSSSTLECSLLIEKLFSKFLPKGVFQTVIADTKGVNYLMNYIEGVSLTGSVNTGKVIGENAGKRIKKFVLELGGSDPFIVLKDAKLRFTCENAVKARFINSGQSCIAAKRFIVVKDIADEFADKLLSLVEKLKVGDPLKKTTDIGPLVNYNQLLSLDIQVKKSIKQGAKVLYGGKIINNKGYFYMPTLITNTNNKTAVIKEETFGPVMPIIKVKDDREAIKEANNTEFGLGASIWTENRKKAEDYAKEIEAGAVAINSVVRSDPRMPFGGVKASGIGRELSRYGLLEFTNVKSVVVN